MNTANTVCPLPSDTTSQLAFLVVESTILLHELQYIGGGSACDNLG